MPYQRDTHYLDESLQAVLSLNCVKCPSEVARILVNLCGAVRALERENEALCFALSKIENGRPDPDEIEAAAPAVVPVAVAERPWENGGWTDLDGECWWCPPDGPAHWSLANPAMVYGGWLLPAHAIPFPQAGEGASQRLAS
jgi:hypothetical protein